MTYRNKHRFNRREFLKQTAVSTAALTAGLSAKAYAAKAKSVKAGGKKVIIIGVDGMDPRLSEKMMNAGKLPNFARLAQRGGYKTLGTSIPPQSPVAWANFINGAGPGSHGIFDFIHRDPQNPTVPFFSAAETIAGEGYWQVGDHKIQLDFWPFNHKLPKTLLKRQGRPFWDYLDKAGIYSTFYNLPSNYPPSSSKYGYHRCLSGMGTPDLLGTYGTYQHYGEDGPLRTKEEGGGRRSMLFFDDGTAKATLTGPPNTLLKNPEPADIDFLVHRDNQAKTIVIEIQNHKILLKQGQWSDWVKLNFELSTPAFIPDKNISGICRFYLQQFEPELRLYVTPINADPTDSAIQITEPPGFIKEISNNLGLFYTTGFQEDHKVLSNGVFTEDEFITQTGIVLEERLNLLDYAMDNYDDGLLYFYFSSTDLQAHMLWWDSNEKHPTRSAKQARMCFDHLKTVYQKMDDVLGDILKRYGDKATVIVISDHGFANFKRQFDLNTWLRQNGYIGPANSTSVLRDIDWSQTRAYGLGINGLYLNTKGRERDGIVKPGQQREELISELINKLEAVTDTNGRGVIKKVHRADKTYLGSATALAPDLIIGYSRDYRASWSTCLGDMAEDVLSDNDSVWAADHCGDASEVPGVVFSNRPIKAVNPSLIDIAPTVLTEFGLETPSSMEGKNIF